MFSTNHSCWPRSRWDGAATTGQVLRTELAGWGQLLLGGGREKGGACSAQCHDTRRRSGTRETPGIARWDRSSSCNRREGGLGRGVHVRGCRSGISCGSTPGNATQAVGMREGSGGARARGEPLWCHWGGAKRHTAAEGVLTGPGRHRVGEPRGSVPEKRGLRRLGAARATGVG